MERKFKGSKGTWSVGFAFASVVTDNGEGFNQTTGHSDVDNYGGYLIAESILKEADRRLISAAPDMLEALQELVHLHLCEQEGVSSGQPSAAQWLQAVDKAEIAITKALGE